MKHILGVDTSNYTTSVALCDFDGNIVLNKKIMLPVKPGSRGLRQSDAVFEHTRNIPLLMQSIKGYEISAVSYSKAPRDNENSYMPCFLVGRSVASALSNALNIPIYSFSHQRGHIRAALYSCGREDLTDGKFIAFHLSGGTSEILSVETENINLIGGTNDLTFGQLIDRVGVALNLHFPCGRQMDEIACYTDIPKIKTSVSGLHFNISGAENKITDLINQNMGPEIICGTVFDFILNNLRSVCKSIRGEYSDIPMIFSGGVSSNSHISKAISKEFNGYFCEAQYSCDNACGTALLALDMIKNGK